MSLLKALSPRYREMEALLREILPRMIHAPDCAVRDRKPCNCYVARAKEMVEGN